MKSQKEGQEDQGEVKKVRGTPLPVLLFPGPPSLPPVSSLGSLEHPLGGTFKGMRELHGLKSSY